MQTEPEQWAEELRDAVELALDGMDPEFAALTIQRAFEDQTRKLREAAEGVMPVLDGMPMFGTEATARTETLRQALKETPDAQ